MFLPLPHPHTRLLAIRKLDAGGLKGGLDLLPRVGAAPQIAIRRLKPPYRGIETPDAWRSASAASIAPHSRSPN